MLEYRQIITYIFAIGAAQAVFLFFILWKKKENSFANKFLAITMIVFALDLLGGVAYLSEYIKHFPWILGLNNSFPYLYGPLIYLYIIFLIHKFESFENYNYLHFIPFFLVHLYGLFFFYFEGPEYQLGLLNFNTEPPWHIKLIGLIIPVHGCIYMVITIWQTLRYNKKIKNSFSNIDNIDLSWLIYLVVGTVLIWLVVLMAYLLDFIYGEQFQANMLIYIVISIFLYTLAIKSYKQPEMELTSDEEDNSKSYQKSGLSEKKAEEILKRVTNLMTTEKPFLESKFNLRQLSDKTNISTHNLSEVINTKLNQNFYDFINNYRVEEVKNYIKMDVNSTYSILAHGFEAGFTSKSTYYSAFKKFTGLTPAQFRINT